MKSPITQEDLPAILIAALSHAAAEVADTEVGVEAAVDRWMNAAIDEHMQAVATKFRQGSN